MYIIALFVDLIKGRKRGQAAPADFRNRRIHRAWRMTLPVAAVPPGG
jgi:hypothetical protein